MRMNFLTGPSRIIVNVLQFSLIKILEFLLISTGQLRLFRILNAAIFQISEKHTSCITRSDILLGADMMGQFGLNVASLIHAVPVPSSLIRFSTFMEPIVW